MTMKRIKRFGVYQTAKVFGIIYFLATAIFLIPIGLIVNMAGGDNLGGLPFGGGMFFLILPVFYGIIGFLITALGCFIYNLIVQWTGGIEIEVEN
jgi:hypothetical protein